MPTKRDVIRAFLAVNMPDEVRNRVAALMDSGRSLGRGPRWVAPANLHLTVKFLGEITPDLARRVGDAARDLLADRPSFGLELAGLGAFPSPARPRVIFIGLGAGEEIFIDLMAAVDDALRPLGFRPEKRTAHPHLTLARIKDSRRLAGVSEWLASRPDSRCGSFQVAEASLMQSNLRPQGPIYTVLEKYPLGGNS